MNFLARKQTESPDENYVTPSQVSAHGPDSTRAGSECGASYDSIRTEFAQCEIGGHLGMTLEAQVRLVFGHLAVNEIPIGAHSHDSQYGRNLVRASGDYGHQPGKRRSVRTASHGPDRHERPLAHKVFKDAARAALQVSLEMQPPPSGALARGNAGTQRCRLVNGVQSRSMT